MKYNKGNDAHYNFDAILERGGGIKGIIAVLEAQVVFDGKCVHETEFQSYCDYEKHVEPLLHFDEEMAAKAIAYTSSFFYLKGLQDGVYIKSRLFGQS